MALSHPPPLIPLFLPPPPAPLWPWIAVTLACHIFSLFLKLLCNLKGREGEKEKERRGKGEGRGGGEKNERREKWGGEIRGRGGGEGEGQGQERRKGVQLLSFPGLAQPSSSQVLVLTKPTDPPTKIYPTE